MNNISREEKIRLMGELNKDPKMAYLVSLVNEDLQRFKDALETIGEDKLKFIQGKISGIKDVLEYLEARESR